MSCCSNFSDISSCVTQLPARHCGARPATVATSKAGSIEMVVSVLETNKPPNWMRSLVQEYGGHLTAYVKSVSSTARCNQGGCKYDRSERDAGHVHDVVRIPDIGRSMCTFYHHVATHFNELPEFTLFMKTNIVEREIVKDLLDAASIGLFLGIDHPWLAKRRRFLSVICDPRWGHLPIYHHLCPCKQFPPNANFNVGPLARYPIALHGEHKGDEAIVISCMDEWHIHVQFLRQGLNFSDSDGSARVLRFPLIFEHYEEDIYLAHKDILRTYPRSFWDRRERACEEIGELRTCPADGPPCTHQSAAQQWAYLISKGGLLGFPPYLVSPGVRLFTNHTSGAPIPQARQAEWLKELAKSLSSSAQDCQEE